MSDGSTDLRYMARDPGRPAPKLKAICHNRRFHRNRRRVNRISNHLSASLDILPKGV
jgi:hypothetical protein